MTLLLVTSIPTSSIVSRPVLDIISLFTTFSKLASYYPLNLTEADQDISVTLVSPLA